MHMMNPHMKPLRAPLRGSYAPAVKTAMPSQSAPAQGGFSAVASARAQRPGYPDPGWAPKPGGNALPAQHAMQQMQDAPPMPAPSGQAFTGTGGTAPQKFAGAAAARAGQSPQGAPAAQRGAIEAAPPRPPLKTAAGVAESYGELDGSYRGGLDHAEALARAGYEVAHNA